MSLSQLALLREYGIRPVKRRGQHFLTDGNLARAIASDCLVLGRELLELGAGGGALTGPLLDGGARVIAVEVDRNLCQLLRGEFGDRPGFTLVEQDLAHLDWEATIAQLVGKPVVVGNLPYVLTSEVLFALAQARRRIAGAIFMVQKEVADRLTAAPGGRQFGVLAVLLGSLFEMTRLRSVPPTVFWPQPEVASAVVRLTPYGDWSDAQYRRLRSTVKILFAQRRKQVGTLLRSSYNLTSSEVNALAAGVGFNPDQRPEQLELAVWHRLAERLGAEENR